MKKIIKNIGGRDVHRAGWIVVAPDNIIENGYLEAENGLIKGIFKGKPRKNCIDHGPGVLIPPLVNAHLHLELSALRKLLPLYRGFKIWVEKLLEKRKSLGEKKLSYEAGNAARSLFDSGSLYIGEISGLGITKPLVEASGLKGVWFHEFLGPDNENFLLEKKKTVSFSVAGHAPHTSSPLLLKRLKKASLAKGLPFSIHVSESEEETEFVREKKGSWAEFLTSKGINYLSWDISSKSPVRYLDDLGVLDPLTIAVHALNADEKDLDVLVGSGTKICVCPRSNQNLHLKLPDIGRMIEKGIEPALGTDSLASCDSLDIFDEMAFVKDNYPGLDPETIFSMATRNGAKALGFDSVAGSLEKGKKAQFLYLPINANDKKNILQKITSNER